MTNTAKKILRRKETREEALLSSMCRALISLRLRNEDAKRHRFVSSREDMQSDLDCEAQRRAILRTLEQIHAGPDWQMVSPTKERMFRSIARGRLSKKDLTLREPPVRSTNNRVTGRSSVTYKNGRTETFTPVKVKS